MKLLIRNIDKSIYAKILNVDNYITYYGIQIQVVGQN